MKRYIKLFESWRLNEAEDVIVATSSLEDLKALVDKYENMKVSDLMADQANTKEYTSSVRRILNFYRAGGKLTYTTGTLPDKKKFTGATIDDLNFVFAMEGDRVGCDMEILSDGLAKKMLEKPDEKVIDAAAIEIIPDSGNPESISMKQLFTMLYAGVLKKGINKGADIKDITGRGATLQGLSTQEYYWTSLNKVLSGGSDQWGNVQQLANGLKIKIGSTSPEAEA